MEDDLLKRFVIAMTIGMAFLLACILFMLKEGGIF